MDTLFSEGVTGPSGLRMRLVQPEDAGYIYALRTDPTYNTYLSPVSGGIEAQAAWIKRYKQDEAADTQYYCMIERQDGQACGLVRLYDIQSQAFTWGSWILDANKPTKAALESAYLIYDIAFNHLSLDRAVFEVMRENAHTQAFHRRFGARETGMDDTNVYFEYAAAQFQKDQPRFIDILKPNS